MAPRRARVRTTVRINGIARLRQRLEALPEEIIDGLRRGVEASAEAVRDETARTVPVASGNLQGMVDIRYEADGLVANVGWFENEEYYAAFVELGTRRRPATPSLHPALEAERTRYRARLTEEVRRALR
ncbi:HK97-gp10 family putative phage morphogenesis protein [Streptomyces sp. NPDC006477]|uniref:HK97-gp10 family putative phage morphogenesis protein n=1 Tax=Streptomyces sp. NPDC006477 TaxID=3364747 RepID=UPI0036C8AA85